MIKSPIFFLLLSSLAFAVDYSPPPPGGNGTVSDETENAFQHPFAGIERELQRKFFVGNSFFRDVWVAAPSSTKGRDGLGPTFNAISCSSCHGLDGRGMGFNREGKIDLSLLFRLSVYDGEKFVPHPNYGDQLNSLALDGVEPEAQANVTFEIIVGTYPDGKKYELRRPEFHFTNLNFGSLDKTRISPRVAPQMIGLGLLEAIDQKDILALEDAKDADSDGVSGRANWVKNDENENTELGRFGWKANKPNLRTQNAGAFLGDIGITSSIFPKQNCPEVQKKCNLQPNGGEPELQDALLDRVTTYAQLLAVPHRRIKDPVLIARGDRTFTEIGCVKCHTPSFTTGNTHELEILRNQKITPYTDLLLHDMGMDLADHRPDGKANGKEWKTPPLWGIGLIPTVNKHSNLLHDGRARNVEEAILWHGGEAEQSKKAFMALSEEDRKTVIAFVNSL